MTTVSHHIEISAPATALVKSVTHAASDDQARPILCNVNFAPETADGQPASLQDADRLVVWATDSYRIHAVTFDQTKRGPSAIGFSASHTSGAYIAFPDTDDARNVLARVTGADHVIQLPAKFLSSLIAGKGGREHATVTVDTAEPGSRAPLTFARGTYGDKSRDEPTNEPGNAPPVRQLWPADPGNGTMLLPVDTFATLAKLARTISKDGTPLAFRHDPTVSDAVRVRLTAAHADSVHVEQTVGVMHGDTIDPTTAYGVNPLFLADAARHTSVRSNPQLGTFATVRVRDNLKPYVLGDHDGPGPRALVMPVRLDGLPGQLAALPGVDRTAVQCDRAHTEDVVAAGRSGCDLEHVTDDIRASLVDLNERVLTVTRERDAAIERHDATTAELERVRALAQKWRDQLTEARARVNHQPREDATVTTITPAPDPCTPSKAERRERNRQLAAALRERGITPNGDVWRVARARLGDGMPVDEAADMAAGRDRATA